MEKASFSLLSYKFTKVLMDLSLIKDNFEIVVDFMPSGEFMEKERIFYLKMTFTANDKNDSDSNLITIECESTFHFNQEVTFATIPDFFYANSIAIIFPYIRAFVSTLTLQANTEALVLPTMNLSSLKEVLKRNTIKK